jgi:AmmeMemoRadiSam system protein A
VTPLALIDRAALLGIARGAILAHLGLAPGPALSTKGRLAEPGSAFVTLRVRGELRGCIGTFHPSSSLAQVVSEMAIAAASQDPRFPPLSAGDIPELDVSVSVLDAPRKLEDLRSLEVGRHGLVVRNGWHHGALLPRVAVDHGWDAAGFLKHVCLKAGLPARAWQEPDTLVQVFEAEEFGQETTA